MSWLLMMSQPGGGGQNPLMGVPLILLIFVVFYFLLIRPQQKRAKEHRQMIGAMKSGDRVVTIGGIRGVVTAVDGETVVIRVADNVKITFSKSAVAGTVQE